jgi:hypothetical protein
MTTTAEVAPASGPGPAWTARRVADEDRSAVLALFTEPDFYFRTTEPSTRPEWEILALVDEDTRILLRDGRPAGLFAFTEVGAEHGCHFELELRLSSALPLSDWSAAYEAAVAALRWRTEVIRVVTLFGEFDERGLAFARGHGLREEGTLAAAVVHDGRRYGRVFFSRIWELTP